AHDGFAHISAHNVIHPSRLCGINLNLVSAFLVPWFPVLVLFPPPALWELWESRSVFCGGFSKHLGGNHQENAAEGILLRFPQVRQFPQRSPSLKRAESLDRFCRLKREMPQAATWGLSRVINPLSGAN